MKKNLKIIFISLLVIISFFMINKVKAATTKLSTSSSSVTAGDTITVTVTVNAAQWNLTLTANGKTLDTWTETVNYKENLSKTFEATYKTTEKGTVKFVLSGDITDVDQTNTEINESESVEVKAKPSTNTSGGNNSNTGSNSNSNSNSNSSSSNTGSNSNSGTSTTTKAPKFTSVNETVYATTEVNVRKSYSTSSAIVGSLDEGESVKRTGVGDNGWSKITYDGETAYVYSDYLTKTKPVIEEPEKEESKKEETTNTKPEENKDDEETTKNEDEKDEKQENVVDNNTINNEKAEENEKLGLSKLDIAGVNFTEGFNPEIYLYELKLNFFVKELNVTAEANREDAKIEIIGNENFVEGENNITILVRSADAKETVAYQIKVVVPAEIQEEPQNNLQFYAICGGIILAAIVSIIVVLAIYKAKNNKILNDEENYKEVFTKNNEEKPKKTKGKHSN